MSSTPAPDAFEVGGYSLLSGVARDGLAEHWIARARGQSSLVRVVRLTPPVVGDADSVSAFLAHLEAVREIEHPGVVRVIEARRDADAVLGVLELVEGVTLRELLDASEGKKLPVEIVLRIAHDIASALATLGAEGIVHGDLTPQSIMLLPGGVSVLVPSGLGLATCRLQETASRSRLAYKAPEQVAGEAGDASSDVFALAATLFEALAGHAAFAGHGAELVSSLKRGRGALGTAPADFPRALFAVLAQALEADPKQRPAAARALARSLEDAAGVKAAPRFDLAALVSERAGRDLAALRFEVDLLTGKGGEPVAASAPKPAAEPAPRPAPRPELDAEPTPRSGPPPPPTAASDPNADLFEDTQPSLAKLRASQRQRDRRRRAAFVGLAVAGIALAGLAIGLRQRAPAAPIPVATPATVPPAPEPAPEPTALAEPVPVPAPEAEPEAVAATQPAPEPTRARARRAPARPAEAPIAEPVAPAKPKSTENPNPPRSEPPAYTAPAKPPPAPTVDIPSGI